MALLLLGALSFDQPAALAKDALGPPITLTEAREAEAEAISALEETRAEPTGALIVQLPPLPAAAAVVATVAGPEAQASTPDPSAPAEPSALSAVPTPAGPAPADPGVTKVPVADAPSDPPCPPPPRRERWTPFRSSSS